MQFVANLSFFVMQFLFAGFCLFLFCWMQTTKTKKVRLKFNFRVLEPEMFCIFHGVNDEKTFDARVSISSSCVCAINKLLCVCVFVLSNEETCQPV